MTGMVLDGTNGITFPDATNQLRGGARQLAQMQTFATGALLSGATGVPFDNTIPQNTEGDQYLSLSITPINASSTLEIDVTLYASGSALNPFTTALFQDANVNAIATASNTFALVDNVFPTYLKLIIPAGTTSSTTFKVRAGGASGWGGTMRLNGNTSGQVMGGVMQSRITIKEYLP